MDSISEDSTTKSRRGDVFNATDKIVVVSDFYPDDEEKTPNSPRTTRRMISKTTIRIAPQINFFRRADLGSIK